MWACSMIRLLLRHIVITVVLCFTGGELSAQSKYYQQWYFGPRQGFDFRADTVVSLRGGMQTLEGCSSICDPNTGRILLYTDGSTVWNGGHSILQNGDSLYGNLSCAQSSLIVPYPEHTSLFYIFTLDGTTLGGPRAPQGLGLHYSVVDMRKQGGQGAVVQKNVSLFYQASEKLAAVRHANGCDYWIITHELGSNKFYAWLLTRHGLYTEPVVSVTGSSYGAISSGYLKASPNGKFLFAARSLIDYDGSLGELFRFDAQTGAVGNRVALIPAGYGASFSPDNRFLYTSRADSLLQFDLSVDSSLIVSTAALLNRPQQDRYIYGMQIGPDGKVYVVDGPEYSALLLFMRVGVIHRPTAAGALANYQEMYNYGGVNFFAGLPNCIDGYLGERSDDVRDVEHSIKVEHASICFGDSTTIHVKGGVRYQWVPNPSLSCDTCADVIVKPTEKTTYMVVLYDPYRCPSIDTLKIVVHVEKSEVDAGPDQTICLGSSVQLQASEGVEYQWTPAKGLSCDDCANPVAQPKKTTTYYVVVMEEEGGCAGIDSVTVTVNEVSPVRILPRDTLIACGERFTLRAPGGMEYQWSPAATLSCVDCPNPTAWPQERTTYYLNVVDSTGCSALDSITVDLSNKPVYAGEDTTVCIGKPVQLKATGRKEYRWTPAEGLSCDDCPNPTATPIQDMVYVVEGTTNGRCRSYDTLHVRVSGKAEAGDDTVVCLGDSTQLMATGGDEYYWTPAHKITCLYCPDPVVFPLKTTTYYVRVTNKDGCIAWDSVTVAVENNGSVLATGDTAFCVGGTAQLLAEGAASYQWTPTEGLSCEDCPNPKATPTETTTYYVLGSNANGSCPALDSVTVVVHDFPIADAGEGGAVCLGEHAQLNASGGARYRWDASTDLSCEDCPDPKVTPTKTTTYYLTVWNAEGCSDRDSVEVVVHPSLVVDAGEDQMICSGESLELRAEGGVCWEWSPSAGLSCTDCQNPVAMPSATTLYRVRAWNAEGCSAEDFIEVHVREAAEVIRVQIGRSHQSVTDQALVIPVQLLDTVHSSDISEFEFSLEYDANAMLLDETSIQRLLQGTVLDGWNVDVIHGSPGELRLHFQAPSGITLSGTGDLFRFEGRVFLYSKRGTELSFVLSSPSYCYVFHSVAGYAEVASICGLNFRLIELTAQKYVMPTVWPNPGSRRIQFEFGLGLDGPVKLEIYDELGNRTGTLIDAMLDAGLYSVEWDVQDVPSGMYWYRLISGDWERSGQVWVRR